MNVQAIVHPTAAAPVGALPPLPVDLDQEEFEFLCGEKAADRHDMGRTASDAGAVGAIEGLSIVRREIDALGGTVASADLHGQGYNEALAHVLRLLDHLGAEVR